MTDLSPINDQLRHHATKRPRIAASRSAPLAMLGVVLVLFSGCAPFATYPPVEGSVGIDNPAFEPVPSIMADAVWYVHEHHGAGHETFAINLPPGTPAAVYEKVIYILGAGEPMRRDDRWAYHVTQIRSRGLDAEADIIFPRTNGPHALITLKMRKKPSNYQVQSSKVWNFPATPPEPHYEPPVDDTASTTTSNTTNAP